MTMTTITLTNGIAHQGKYGFHPCNYEDFKKIKLLHKHYWIARKRAAAYERYLRKQPQNRLIRKKDGLALAKPLPMPQPFFPNVYAQILKKPIVPLYQQARHPQPTSDQVKMLLISIIQVEEWLTEITEAYAKK
jgi:hypothetical protein